MSDPAAEKKQGTWSGPARACVYEAVIAAVLLVAFIWQAVANAVATSATYDEPVHLAAGFSYWQQGDFRLNPEHPPLLKYLAALPLLQGDEPREAHANDVLLQRYWRAAASNGHGQWAYAHAFLYGMTDEALARLGAKEMYLVPGTRVLDKGDFIRDADQWLFRGRLPGIGFALVLGLLVWLWARSLFGPAAGLLALSLFCFDPNFIANAGLVTTDVAAACCFFAALFGMRRLTLRCSAGNLVIVAVSFALMCLIKFSAVVLLPLLLLSAAILIARAEKISCFAWSPVRRWQGKLMVWAGFCLVLVLSGWLAIWAGYGFRYRAMADPGAVALPLDTVLRQSAAYKNLLADRPAEVAPAQVERALAAAVLGAEERVLRWVARAHLLPEAYVYGFAWVRANSQARYSFLNGHISVSGFPDYFLWTFLLKTPLVSLVAILAGLVLAFRRRRQARGAEWLCLLLPVAVYLVATLFSRLNIGHRHLLPIYPFLFVAAGGLLERCRPTFAPGQWPRLAACLFAVALGCSVVFAPPWRPQVVFADHLSYFNELAGGPDHGYQHLVDSNLDWGQDLTNLARWLREQGIVEPIGLLYFGSADPRFHGISHLNLPGGFAYEPMQEKLPVEQPPRYLVVSATHLQGTYLGAAGRRAWQQFLRRYERIGTVGHSLFVFRLGPEP